MQSTTTIQASILTGTYHIFSWLPECGRWLSLHHLTQLKFLFFAICRPTMPRKCNDDSKRSTKGSKAKEHYEKCGQYDGKAIRRRVAYLEKYGAAAAPASSSKL